MSLLATVWSWITRSAVVISQGPVREPPVRFHLSGETENSFKRIYSPSCHSKLVLIYVLLLIYVLIAFLLSTLIQCNPLSFSCRNIWSRVNSRSSSCWPTALKRLNTPKNKRAEPPAKRQTLRTCPAPPQMCVMSIYDVSSCPAQPTDNIYYVITIFRIVL